jgi:hypothetical protein
LLTSAAMLLVAAATPAVAQAPAKRAAGPSEAAAQLADIFSQIGDQIYEECIFELSPEQLDVQHALIQAYVAQGASSAMARQLAVKQIQPPKLSDKCETIRKQPAAPPAPWETTMSAEVETKPAVKPKAPAPKVAAAEPLQAETPASAAALASLNDMKMPARWDCGANVDFVTISLNGFKRKLTGGEICNPFEDVVHEVPASVGEFRLGYAITTGRLFIVSDDARHAGRTIAWALSGRDVCRNNPDPVCFAARAIGPLPPGEYTFASEKDRRVSWGPKTKRNVAGVWIRKLWNKERFTAQQRAAIMARGNIAIHMRLKGEMSEACIGMEPKGWAHVASLIKDGRATGLNAYIDDPYPQVAGTPPVIEGSSFSLSSLFK